MMDKHEVEKLKIKLKGKKKWSTIKENKDNNKTPTRIFDENSDITSPGKLATLFKKYFNNIIKEMRANFKKNNDMALRVLENVVEKPNTKFNFRPTTVYNVYETIQKAKQSKSSGSDSITMTILTDCQQISARVICHIFNNMIRTGIYPERIKTSKIIPILKSGESPTDKANYRPICIPFKRPTRKILRRQPTEPKLL